MCVYIYYCITLHYIISYYIISYYTILYHMILYIRIYHMGCVIYTYMGGLSTQLFTIHQICRYSDNEHPSSELPHLNYSTHLEADP